MALRVLTLLLSLVASANAAAAPKFVDNMNYLEVDENTPMGTSIYTLYAEDPDGDPVEYDILADMFIVDKYSGVVTLARTLDYENGDVLLSVSVIATDPVDNLFDFDDVFVSVRNVNDNPAEFTRTTYDIRLSENTPVNTIISNLSVEDADGVNPVLITVACNASYGKTPTEVSNYNEACATFRLNVLEYTNFNWRGNLELMLPLDYETTPSYQLPLITFDGDNFGPNSFEIQLEDVNDSPPVFTYTAPGTVNESHPLNTSVTYVVAVDGDITNPRDIRYDLLCTTGPGQQVFAISRTSGIIVNYMELDRESELLSQGFLDLCVTAREVVSVDGSGNEVVGDNDFTTATATIRVNVLDINDNSPTFHQSQFTVNIREDIPNESALPGLIMTVTDLDSGTANSYDFMLLNHNQVFAVFPDRGQGQTTASVKVTNTTWIDYEYGPRQYILRVEARERLDGQPSVLTGSATVTVNVLDVNDNRPTFTQTNYIENILETANIGSQVVDVSVNDPDSGNFGVAGVVFGLVGNGAEKFSINNITGVVTVADCSPRVPGEAPCLDFEATRQYDLTVTATDNLGQGLTQTASLRINILDVNDNRPVFDLTEYAGNIFEGETTLVNPIFATASDADTVELPLVYSIENTGPRSQLWQIDPVTAEITAKQPIRYEDTRNNSGEFILTVRASDQGNKFQVVRVTIYVIDRNDNPPIFERNSYTETIDESTLGGYAILTVVAKDADSPTTDNGRIEYGIDTGAQGRFVINVNTGLISTADDATFDYDLQQKYEMKVLARDGGNPQLTGTTSVTILIRDANNKDPYFSPQTERTEVYENVPIGTSVKMLTAYDVDIGNSLIFRFVEPISAITPDGIQVDRNAYRYQDLFEVIEDTGIVQTKSNLDRDRTSVITFTMLVIDDSANPKQTGTGTLIINILEYNDQSPYFQLPFYNITVDEEQPIGAFVMALIAQDDDDEIANYEIFDQQGNYFAITPTTGVLTVKNRLDYEKVQQTTFQARATDDGSPQRSNTTRVLVNIRNINDNSPIFDKSAYTVTLREHSPIGDPIVTVQATDEDLGDYGVVRYRLGGETRFVIDAESGVIRINADFDREMESTIALQVTAYDSPLDQTVRREYTVPVYIILEDINDNSPIFSSTEYVTTIIETIDIGAQAIQVFATDRDEGNNAIIAFSKLSGDDLGYFDVGRSSGRITVGQSLRGKDGTYVFYVIAEDLNGDPLARNDTAKVTIHVIEATNSPPTWTIPPRDNFTIEVLESQYDGMLVYDVEAEDSDNGKSGIVDYGFYYEGNYTRRTPEFSINRVTGVIRAEIRYDRENVNRYVLLLSARDQGSPSLEAIRFLTVIILDVNDNVPMFPMSNGQTTPYEFAVAENATAGMEIGSVSATDLDTIDLIYYYILAGDRETFGINPTNGSIFLKKGLDRELQAQYTLDIQATNNVSDYTVIRERRRRSTDPSIVTAIITVTDIEDEEPVFVAFNGPNNKPEYFGCISATAPFGKSIVQVEATDADSAGPAGIRYSLTDGNSPGTFDIDPSTGLIYNKRLVDTVTQNVFMFDAVASDNGGLSAKAPVKVFKTTSQNEAKIVINQQSSEVRLFIQQLIRLLQEERDIQYVCVTLIRDHVNADGRSDRAKTDVYVTAAYGAQTDFRTYTTAELITIINEARNRNKNSYDALYITEVGTLSEERSFIEETPVLAVLIIVILLVIMALILFCLACYCISDAKNRKLRRTEAERFTVVSQEPVKTVSPLYDNQGFERDPMPLPVQDPVPVQHVVNEDYAVVQKKRPPSDDFVPVAPVQAPIVESSPMPIIETEVMDDDPRTPEPLEPGPVIVTEIMDSDPEPEPQAVYIPEEPQAVYIPDPEPQAVYIPDPEPETVFVPVSERPEIPEPEPVHLEYVPPTRSEFEPREQGTDEIVVEINDDTPTSTPRHSPPPSPPASPSTPRSHSPPIRRSPSPPPQFDEEEATAVM